MRGDAEPPDRLAMLLGRIADIGLPAVAGIARGQPMHDSVARFLGRRATTLFVHAISTESDCLICSTFFRRILVEAGEDPDALVLSETERALADYGRQLAVDANRVSDELFARLAKFLTPAQIVELTAFGGMMIATNVFNNALQIDLDEYLFAFQAKRVV